VDFHRAGGVPQVLKILLENDRIVALITDGRFSGGSWGWLVGHVAPEAVKDGDSITLDKNKRLIQLNVPAKELAALKKMWKAPKPRYNDGILGEYARHVSSASKGAIAD
jgi:dihydroxy-acid dehydratase